MRFNLRFVESQKGVLLIAIAVVATLWLGATGNLSLYIHPRYNLFSLIACSIGLIIVIWCLSMENETKKSTTAYKLSVDLTVILLAISFTSLLIVKPTTLTSDLANQRGVNSSANSDSLSKLANANVVSPFGNNNLQLSVKEWSSLLSQVNDQAFFTGRTVELEGFVVKDEVDGNNTFFVSRFVLSCCAVDARPVGVPVYIPNWQNSYKADQWVKVEGTFEAINGQRIQLRPTKVTPIDQPKNPYVY